jgi:hypothetical protein
MSRTVTHDVAEFEQDELDLMASNGVTADEVREFIRTSSPQAVNTAISGILAIRSGQGQERNEPFSPQGAPTGGSEETNGVKSMPVEEFNTLSEEDRAKFQA